MGFVPQESFSLQIIPFEAQNPMKWSMNE